MELELQQLDLRYESLRVFSARAERKLLASIGERGQLVPISVVPEKEPGHNEVPRHVVLDGFARVRVLRRLGQDTVRALAWDVGELEALLLVRSLRSSQRESTLEQSWLLAELQRRFDLDQEELARRFDRTQSWVSRRLALVRELPESVHEQIRQGRIVPHAAAKYLVPMARASREDCERLARAIAGEDLSCRDIGELYAGWRDGTTTTRERLIENPALFLRVRRSTEMAAGVSEELLELREALLKEVSVIGAAVRRAKGRLRRGAQEELTRRDLEDLCGSFRAARSEISTLIELTQRHKEKPDAGSGHKDGDPRAA
jgi:ParB/RepB/Spo0J family partition protein